MNLVNMLLEQPSQLLVLLVTSSSPSAQISCQFSVAFSSILNVSSSTAEPPFVYNQAVRDISSSSGIIVITTIESISPFYMLWKGWAGYYLDSKPLMSTEKCVFCLYLIYMLGSVWVCGFVCCVVWTTAKTVLRNCYNTIQYNVYLIALCVCVFCECDDKYNMHFEIPFTTHTTRATLLRLISHNGDSNDAFSVCIVSQVNTFKCIAP